MLGFNPQTGLCSGCSFPLYLNNRAPLPLPLSRMGWNGAPATGAGPGRGAAMRAGGERDWRGASEEWRPRCEWSSVAGLPQAPSA